MKPAKDMSKQYRDFGIMIGLILVLISSWRSYKVATYWDFSTQILHVAALFLAVAWLLPGAFAPIYKLWMKMAEGINFVVTRILLALVFYLAILPIGFLSRVTTGDPLERKFKEPGDDSAWVPRTDMPRPKPSYFRQF